MGQSVAAFFSAGFRPMFLLAALWAVLSMGLWIGFWASGNGLTGVANPMDWHVHELLFGYTCAVLCGFLLTAIPNWTGRAAIKGPVLAGLTMLWLLGRVAMLFTLQIEPVVTAVLDLAFPVAFTLIAAREVIAAGNKRNLPVICMIAGFTLSNLWFHMQSAAGSAMGGASTKLGIALILMLICLIGGRIIPAFTRNWLKARDATTLPPDFAPFDKIVLATSSLTFAVWVITPPNGVVGWVMVVVAGLHVVRLARWRGGQVIANLLLSGLHFAYLFVPMGFFLTGLNLINPDLAPLAAGIHAWLAGGIGLMTLVVMCRASLGHSGRALQAGALENIAIIAVTLAALLRVLAAWPDSPIAILHLSATLWMLGFACFALRFAPVMITPRPAKS